VKDDLERIEAESWRNLGTIPIFISSDSRKQLRNEENRFPGREWKHTTSRYNFI